MNSKLGANEMLALLDTLKGVVRDFAAREEAVNHDFRAKSNAELNAFEFRSRSLESKLTEHSAAAEVVLGEEEERREARFQKRKLAISRAHAAARKRLGDAINEQESRLNDRIRAGRAARN